MGGHAASSNDAIGGSGRRRGCHGTLPAGSSEGESQMRGTVGGGEERREEKGISFWEKGLCGGEKRQER